MKDFIFKNVEGARVIVPRRNVANAIELIKEDWALRNKTYHDCLSAFVYSVYENAKDANGDFLEFGGNEVTEDRYGNAIDYSPLFRKFLEFVKEEL